VRRVDVDGIVRPVVGQHLPVNVPDEHAGTGLEEVVLVAVNRHYHTVRIMHDDRIRVLHVNLAVLKQEVLVWRYRNLDDCRPCCVPAPTEELRVHLGGEYRD
jgi:hypothetical protein